MRTESSKNDPFKGAVQAKSNAAHGLRDLFEVGLKDIYWAEKVLTKTLPKMVKNASSPELVNSLKNQLSETQEHVSRLEKIFEVTGIAPTAKKCDAMEGLIKEGAAADLVVMDENFQVLTTLIGGKIIYQK